MTMLIAFDIYRTEILSINDKKLTARFLRRKDHEAYELLVSDESSGEVWHCGYSKETAMEFANQQGKSLEQLVFKLILSDVENGISHSHG